MIPNQWYAILDARAVPAHRPVSVLRMGEKMVLWRDSQGGVVCQADRCPHRGVALSLGKVQKDCIQCPFHGFEFDADGRCTLAPANGRAAPVPKAITLRTYPAREAYGLIYIWWGEAQPDQELPPLPVFDFMKDPEMRWAGIVDPWPVHYSRAIENQLDIMHLPFVHANSIGSGRRTVTHGPRYTVTTSSSGHPLISVWVDTEEDHGQVAQKASAMPAPTGRSQVSVLMPNLWRNDFGPQMSLMIAFAPVDDTHTILYLRTYQKIITLPVLKEIFFAFAHLGNFYIERQDRRVVITHQPSRSELRMDEKLLPGDGAIIAYRRIRDELINQARR